MALQTRSLLTLSGPARKSDMLDGVRTLRVRRAPLTVRSVNIDA